MYVTLHTAAALWAVGSLVSTTWSYSNKALLPRVDSQGDKYSFPVILDDDSGNGIKDPPGGRDENGVQYIKALQRDVLDRIDDDKLNAIFFTQGGRQDVQNFLDDDAPGLEGKGFGHDNVWDNDANYMRENKLDDRVKYAKIFWTWAYRSSNAMARTVKGKDVYVIMDPSGGRTIFSPPQTYNSDGSIKSVGTGQVWFRAELPALMRNQNVERIHSVQMNEATCEWQVKKEWDINDENDKVKHPRNEFEEGKWDSMDNPPPEKDTIPPGTDSGDLELKRWEMH